MINIAYKKAILITVVFVVVFLATWQDFFLSVSLGEIFKSPVVLISPFFVITEYFLINTSGFYFNKISSVYKYFHLLFLIVTVAYITYWLLSSGTAQILGENIFIKSIKQVLYYSFFWGLFRCFYLLLKKAEKLEIKVDNIFLALVLLYSIIIILEYRSLPNAFSFFHIEPGYSKIRLFTSESSYTGSVVLLLISGLSIGKINKPKFIIGLMFLLLFFALTESKMFLMGIIITTIIFNLKFIKRNKLLSITGLCTFLALFYYFVLPSLLLSFTGDIESFTSVATRSLMYITSIRSVYIFPIGTAGMSFHYFLDLFTESINLLSSYFPDLNFSEALLLGNEGTKGVSPGSTMGNFAILLGIPGLLLLLQLIKYLIRASKSNNVLYFFMLYFIITNVTVESIENKFTYAIFFAIIAYVGDSVKNMNTNNKNESIISCP